ncbi:hypothetical protein ACLOJK_034816 [Asimina triloba]
MIFGAPPEHQYGAPSPSPRPAAIAADGELRRAPARCADARFNPPKMTRTTPCQPLRLKTRCHAVRTRSRSTPVANSVHSRRQQPSSIFPIFCSAAMAAEPITAVQQLPITQSSSYQMPPMTRARRRLQAAVSVSPLLLLTPIMWASHDPTVRHAPRHPASHEPAFTPTSNTTPHDSRQ